MKEKGDFHEIHPTRLSSFSRYPCNETFREKIKEEAAATEKQKGKCGIKQLGVLWVGTPFDEAKVDLSVLRPVPLVRHLKYATHPRTSLSSNIFFLGSTAAARVILNLIVSTGPGATSTRVRGRSCECTSPE